MSREEIKSALESSEQEDFEIYFEDEQTVRSQKVRDILDALDLVDPKNKKIVNILPSGDIPGQEFTTTDYVTLYEPTIDGENRKKLITKLMSLLLEEDIEDDPIS